MKMEHALLAEEIESGSINLASEDDQQSDELANAGEEDRGHDPAFAETDDLDLDLGDPTETDDDDLDDDDSDIEDEDDDDDLDDEDEDNEDDED